MDAGIACNYYEEGKMDVIKKSMAGPPSFLDYNHLTAWKRIVKRPRGKGRPTSMWRGRRMVGGGGRTSTSNVNFSAIIFGLDDVNNDDKGR
jgi:hypothetical protein